MAFNLVDEAHVNLRRERVRPEFLHVLGGKVQAGLPDYRRILLSVVIEIPYAGNAVAVEVIEYTARGFDRINNRLRDVALVESIERRLNRLRSRFFLLQKEEGF